MTTLSKGSSGAGSWAQGSGADQLYFSNDYLNPATLRVGLWNAISGTLPPVGH